MRGGEAAPHVCSVFLRWVMVPFGRSVGIRSADSGSNARCERGWQQEEKVRVWLRLLEVVGRVFLEDMQLHFSNRIWINHQFMFPQSACRSRCVKDLHSVALHNHRLNG